MVNQTRLKGHRGTQTFLFTIDIEMIDIVSFAIMSGVMAKVLVHVAEMDCFFYKIVKFRHRYACEHNSQQHYLV